jgi:hypothetical protein
MPSLYETTAATGDVSSSDFTTLYNASGLTVPNAGAGAVTGNLNVSGNLTVQGTSNLIGAVTIGNTLSTPNYTFPLPDGTTDQVLVTDGNGNLYWTDVTAIPGAAYQIEANTTTGGANLTLLDSAGGTDSVKFASGTGISVSRTDASTITITNTAPDTNTTYTINASATTGGANLNLVGSDSTIDTVKFAGSAHITVSQTDANTITISTDADNIPDGTANGQVLVWESGAWTANSTITSSAAGDRLVLQYDNSTAGQNAALFLRKNYGASTYTTNDGTNLAFQLQSNSQATNQYAQIVTKWSATAPTIDLQTGIAGGTAGPYTSVGSFTTAQATLPGDLAVNGGDITTTASIGNLYNTGPATVNIGNAASTEVNLGNTSSGRVQIKSPSIEGANTTQAIFNTTTTTVNAFGAATAINMGAATGTTTIGHNLSVNGEVVKINADNTAADSYLYMKGTSKYLTWNNTLSRFEFNDSIFTSTTAEPPAQFERKVTTAEINTSLETKPALRLTERVTDAVSNATNQGGSSIMFSRASGTTPGSTEVLYGNIASRYYGVTNSADIVLQWSNDNFAEATPGNYPGSYTLFRAGSYDADFYNDSIFINYSALGGAQIATSITGGNTLVFSSPHGYTVGQRIYYTSTTQNGLTQNTYYYVLSTGFTTTQCRVGLTSSGSAVALTNGSGLTLTFNNLINQVGINTASPAYTLDVNGDANVSGNITTGGITAGNITVGVVTDNTISTTSGALDITAATGSDMTLTTTTSANPVTLARITANTNTPTRAATLKLGSTGTPAVGIGTRLEFSTQTGASTYFTGAYIQTRSTNIGSGTETFDIDFLLANAGTTATRATLSGAGDLTISGDLAVNGGDVTTTSSIGNLFNTNATVVNIGNAATTEVNLGSPGAGRTQVKSALLEATGNLQVDGNAIKSSTAATAITLSNTDVEVVGDLTVTGNDIKSSGGTTAITMSGADVAIAGNLGVDITATNVTVQIGSQTSMITAQTITTSTATVALTTSTRSSMNGSVTIKDNVTSALHTVNFTVLRNGATALLTTYGELYTSAALANFTADVSGAVIRLLATPVSANNTTFNAVRTAIS